jgi:hypothetical protein
VRVSLANLPEETYPKIGQYLRETAMAYVKEWEAGNSTKFNLTAKKQKSLQTTNS